MHGTWKKALAPALAVAVSALSLSATAVPASASGTKPTYTIAYEGPLSGGNAQLGLNMKYSVELAINQANAGTTFGTLPFTLKFKAADDQGSAHVSPTTAQELVSNSQVMAVVGPAFSGATEAAEPTFSAANLATVTPSATDPILAQKGWHNFFRVVADDNAQGPADAQYVAKKLAAKSVYTVDDASAYAAGLVTAFDTEAKSLGVSVTHQTALARPSARAATPATSTEYPALATTIKSSKAPVTFYAGYYCDFALLAKALRTAGYTGTLLSDDGSLDPHYVSEAGPRWPTGPTQLRLRGPHSAAGGDAVRQAFKKLAKFPSAPTPARPTTPPTSIIDVMKSLGTNVTRAGS